MQFSIDDKIVLVNVMSCAYCERQEYPSSQKPHNVIALQTHKLICDTQREGQEKYSDSPTISSTSTEVTLSASHYQKQRVEALTYGMVTELWMLRLKLRQSTDSVLNLLFPNTLACNPK